MMTNGQLIPLDEMYPEGWLVTQEGHTDRLVIRNPNHKEIGATDGRQAFLQFIWAPDGDWSWNLADGGLEIGLRSGAAFAAIETI